MHGFSGEESGYPVDMCKEAYVVARENFIQSTVHAGEDYGPESIYSALTGM